MLRMTHHEKIMETKQLNFPLALEGVADNGTFTGYASVFNVTDSQKDVIAHGAFTRTLQERGGDIKLLWQHRMDEPIGVITLLREDMKGLYVEGKLLLDVQRGREAWTLLKSGAINGLSIGFRAVHFTRDTTSDTRWLTDIELYEISLVTFPANPQAGVMRVKDGIPGTLREFEHFLRDAGFSRNEAKSIALEGFRRGEEAASETDEYTGFSNVLERAIGILQY